MNLDSIFNNNSNNEDQGERRENPTIKIAYADKDKQVIRFRFLEDLNKLEVMIRHFVPEINRYVACNQKPGQKQVKDSAGNKIPGKFEPTLWSHSWENNVKTPHCELCEEKAKLKRELTDKALAEGRAQLTKEEGTLVQKVYKRQLVLKAPVEAEVKEGNKVVRPMGPGALLFQVYDLFFPQFKAQYKQLKSKFDSKKTLLDHWFIMNGEGTIDLDDKLTKEEKAVTPEVDLAYYDAQTLSYAEGIKRLAEKKAAADKAEPMDDDNIEEVPAVDEEIPF
jgi:hypothetical protein